MILTAGYDRDGNRTSLAANIGGIGQRRRAMASAARSSGGTDDFQNSYSYDALNEMLEVAQARRPPAYEQTANSVTGKSAAFGYDADGEVTAMSLYQDANAHTTDQTDTSRPRGEGCLRL